MAKPKSKPSPAISPDEKTRLGSRSTASTPTVKAEEHAPDPMSIDSPPTIEIKSEVKTESRTISPAPPDTIHIMSKYDFDGALLLEEPEFDEDFVPAEGEEIDLTSLAIAAPAPPAGEGETTSSTANKRAMDEAEDGFEDGPSHKRRKLEDGEELVSLSASSTGRNPSSVDRINPSLWIEIFTYVGLPSIGRLRSVCKRFKELLEREYIWRRCRKIHCPDMPKPAFGMKEWDMWALARGRGCLKCSKYDGEVRNEGNLKVYWQFRARCCTSCFRKNIVKEADLLAKADGKLSVDIVKQLISALPYGLVDANYNWVPTTTVNPTDAEKIYWNEDIMEIKQRYEEAQQMDAAEEWLKGLEGEGHGHKADADRMEKWEVRVMNGNSYNPSTNSTQKKGANEKSGGKDNVAPSKNSNGIPVLVSNDNPPFQPQSIPTFYQRGRQFGDRSQEVEDMKARRKADIEARCLKLTPPITPEVLVHCLAFQASLKIPQPLNEQSWNALLPKLLEQRAGAEEYEKQRQLQRKQLEQQLEDRKLLESQERDQWVKKERQWEEAQAPVRDLISKIADEEIKGWDGKIKFETAPAFAASILTTVRTRYYEQGGVQEASSASENTPTASSSSKNPKKRDDRSKPRQLVLENMKYVFDNKIKPVTDPFRRELFFCKACKNLAANPTPGAVIPHSKLYGFEGVIQHFAAKHTTNLSLGTVVVHWRSVWPEDAPFVVDPNEIKRLMARPVERGGGNGHPGNTQGHLLIRTPGPPVPVPGGYNYPQPPPPSHHSSLHSHPQQHSMQHGPQPPVHGPNHFGRGIPPRPPYPMENAHHPGYQQSQPIHQSHHPHASQVPPAPHHPYAHPGHQHYPSQGHGATPIVGRGPSYPPQVGYPPQPAYNQPQTQPHATLHPQPSRQHYTGYQSSQFPPTVTPPQTQYGAYPPPLPPSVAQMPGNIYHGPSEPTSNVPQLDPYEEATKKEAEAAAAAAAEKDRKDKIHYIANYAEQMWKNLGNLKNLELSIRALLMIHDTYAAYYDRYNTELSVNLFHEAIRAEIDGPLKFLKQGNHNFECRSCLRSTRAFTLPLLFQHFESIHVSRPSLGPSAKEQGLKAKRYNWLVDMIRLPSEEEVRKMMSRPGFDKKKMAPVEKVYPGVFDKPVEPAPETTPTTNVGVGANPTAAKHASKDSMSIAEDFLNTILPGAIEEPIQTRPTEPKTGKAEPTARSPEPERGRPERAGRAAYRYADSLSRSPSLEPKSGSRLRRGSFDDDDYRRPLPRDAAYADEIHRRYPPEEAPYYGRPVRARSPVPYDRYASPVEYRIYPRRYDNYDGVPRERYPSPPPPIRQPEPQQAAIPPPAGGLDYDEAPPPPIPVSGHVREAGREGIREPRFPEDIEYRRAYPPPAGYYERVIERDPRYPPPPPRGYYEPPPPRYYDERVVHHPYYDDYMYEYERARPPPVRVYREEYDRYYDRPEGYRRPPPPLLSAPRERDADDAFDRATGRDVRRGRSRSPEIEEREWSGRERRGYGAGALSPRDWRDESVRGGRGGFRGRGGRGG